MTTTVVLGSASPARLRVLRNAGVEPVVRVSDVDEDALIASAGPDAAPSSVVNTLARAKADSVVAMLAAQQSSIHDTVVIGCDSMLLVDGTLTGKPHRPEVARDHWRRVRGRSAELLTGHCVVRIRDGVPPVRAQGCASTVVRFADVDDQTIDAYVDTGEPLEVAGGFTLDGRGGWLIDGIDGDHSAVVGIGLPLVRRLFAQVGVSVTDVW